MIEFQLYLMLSALSSELYAFYKIKDKRKKIKDII
jgi:hypothetical protein